MSHINHSQSNTSISPLRQRMIEEMKLRILMGFDLSICFNLESLVGYNSLKTGKRVIWEWLQQ